MDRREEVFSLITSFSTAEMTLDHEEKQKIAVEKEVTEKTEEVRVTKEKEELQLVIEVITAPLNDCLNSPNFY